MRFLVCFVSTPDRTPSLQLKVYPLKYATSPDEVTYPTGTVCFAFTEAESANSLYEEFIVFKPANGIELGSMKLMQQQESKFYLVGTKVNLEGQTFVRNSHTGTLLPFKEDGKTIVVPE